MPWCACCFHLRGGGDAVADGTAYAPKGANNTTYAESNSYWGRAGLKFIGLFADGRRINLKVMDDGLYAPKKGLVLIVK